VNYFLLQMPKDVGAKYTLPSSDSANSGAVQMPMRGILRLEVPGISLRVILRLDL
jgi:hypothetical protein